MKKIIMGVLVFCLAFGLTSNAYSQKNSMKIGIVDVEMIVKAMPEAAEADANLKTLTQQYRDSLLAIQKSYVDKAQQFDKQKAMMTPAQQQTEQEALKNLEMSYAKFQEDKFGNTGEIVQLREKFLEPIRGKVKTAIAGVAKEENMNFVLDKNSPNLLFAEDEYDVTFKVLDRIKRGTPKK
jgi:outer membrane protein